MEKRFMYLKMKRVDLFRVIKRKRAWGLLLALVVLIYCIHIDRNRGLGPCQRQILDPYKARRLNRLERKCLNLMAWRLDQRRERIRRGSTLSAYTDGTKSAIWHRWHHIAIEQQRIIRLFGSSRIRD